MVNFLLLKDEALRWVIVYAPPGAGYCRKTVFLLDPADDVVLEDVLVFRRSVLVILILTRRHQIVLIDLHVTEKTSSLADLLVATIV